MKALPTGTKATPSISTTQKPATVAVGSSIADKATVSGGYHPTGTVTFKLYTNPYGTGTALFSATKPLSNGSATSASHTTTRAGTYYWVATYNGDTNNNTAPSGAANEPVTVTKATPSLLTKRLPGSAKMGRRIADKATVSGGYNPSGTVTFRLYKNPKATGKPVFTSTKSLSQGSATSARYKPKKIGKYYWVVTYNGDANNAPISSGKATQRVLIHR